MVISVKSNFSQLKMDKQEFVGNCKEFRIDTNQTHLRIIGNGNKIRLKSNNGHLEVIGNTTRVKVINNYGQISYTGNSGKVYLGCDSTVKQVNYVGNNGILKIWTKTNENNKKFDEKYYEKDIKVSSENYKTSMNNKSAGINAFQCSTDDDDDDDADDADIAIGRKQQSFNDNPKMKTSNQSSSHQFQQNRNKKSNSDQMKNNRNSKSNKNNVQQSDPDEFCVYIKNNISMPDLDAVDLNARISNSIRIASSTGNIVVNNSFAI